jgi:anti-sigma factor RsiW
MNAEVHKFQPEEVMAYLDGEITGERALALADHIEQCLECASLADDFRSLSQQLIAWKIEPSLLVESPADLGVEALTAEEAMGAFKSDKDFIAAVLTAQESAPVVGRKSSLLSSLLDFIRRPRVQGPWVWALASACAVLLIVSMLSPRMAMVAPSQSVPAYSSYETKTQDELAHVLQDPKARDDLARHLQGLQNAQLSAQVNHMSGGADTTDNSVNGIRKSVSPDAIKAFKGTDNLPVNGRQYIDFSRLDTSVHSELATKVDTVDTATVPVQMIERTASLSITVKEMDAARAAIEDIEKRHHGYFADLNTEGQSEAGRTLAASLRVPADELDATLAELRKLGHLDEEKQGGEEVSQQHVDLYARRQNARNTEKRLTDLLTKRADKLKDVLDVERELASTREEIERMEAQLRNMEKQVSYASIDVKLREEYKPALNLAPPATGTRLRNALVDGYKSAMESALGLVLFVFQEGPTILFWLLLLFFPARWTWRNLRAAAVPKPSPAVAL